MGFTLPWYALGVVTSADVAVLEQEWARGEDRFPEHYRWRAFRAFVTARRPLPADLAIALYELGAMEADQAMGESIMHEVAALPECPHEVLERARASGRRHLIKAATRSSV